MNDSKDSKNEQSAPKKLQLTRRVETGSVQQTFARGRSKTVTVEMRRTRTFSRTDAGKMVEEEKSHEDDLSSLTQEERDNLRGLTDEEKATRLSALEKAKSAPADDFSLPPLPKPRVEKPEETNIEELKKPLTIKEKSSSKPSSPAIEKKDIRHTKFNEDQVEEKKVRLSAERRQKGRLTITNAFDQDEKVRSLASIKRARQKAKRQSTNFNIQEQEKAVREVIIPEKITVQELANRMAVRSQEVIKELMKLEIMATVTQDLDADTAELVVSELGHIPKRVTEADVEDILKDLDIPAGELVHRAPVVTIMGHVDHGKTSLLDALRSTNVTGGEAGGITQHIGAYQITTETGEKITFLDTPGHEAFTAMRARGAKVTDIVVLVVAADDGIMPQTEEAINHAKAAEVPIIVAINKIDKPDANPKKVKDALLKYELVPEDLGGDTMVVEVSAKEKLNLDKLIEAILLQAEVLELKSSPDSRASGTVIEAKIDKGKGVIATLLVQRGTLKPGDIVVAGTGFGRIKALTDYKGSQLTEAGPSTPVEVLGLDEAPGAGDTFAVVEQEKQAREIIEYRNRLRREVQYPSAPPATAETSLDELFQVAQSGKKELRMIIKGDVQGSIEAICGSLNKLSNDEVIVKIIHSGVGAITESDVTLAAAVGAAMIVGFNVRASNAVRNMASEEGVAINYYSIIYNLTDDIKAAVSGLMKPVIHEKFLGNAEIMQVFKVSKAGKVAGCLVRDGIVKRGSGVRLIRDNVVIHEGKLKTLKRFKDDVSEVKDGMECGMAFENYDDIKEGDTIEAFELVEQKKS